MKKLYFLVFAWLFFGQITAQTTHFVSNTNDTGPGSFRQTVVNAVAGDVVRFNDTLIGDTIFFASQLSIDKELTIVGLYDQQDTLCFSTSANTRMLKVTVNSGLTLDSLKFIDGHTGEGGAIYVQWSTLTIKNSVFADNYATYGGALRTKASTVNIDNCEFRNNSVSHYGGAAYIHNSTDVTIVNSSFHHNSALSGGALFVSSSSDLDMSYSTLHHNTVSNRGGGIFSDLSSSNTLRFVTVAYNNAVMNGGVEFDGASAEVSYSTIAANNSGNGVGLRVRSDSLKLYHTLIAANGSSSLSINATATVVSEGFNLIESTNFSFVPQSTDIASVTAPMGVLADNGGHTLTILPLPGNPAIDAGDTSLALAQNGMAPVGTRDIGAAETNYAQGCTDSLALNFDASAIVEDSSCVYCTTPSNFSVDAMVTNMPDGSRVHFGWDGGNQYQANMYELRYRAVGQTNWITQTMGAATGPISGQSSSIRHFLSANTVYEAELRRHCVNQQYTAYAAVQFTTPIACPEPTNLQASNVEANWLTLSYDAPVLDSSLYVHTYLIRFSEDAGASWDYKNPGTTLSATVGNRTAGASLQWQVRSQCNGDNYYRSDWVDGVVVQLQDAALPPANLSSVEPSQTSSQPGWVNDANFRHFSWEAPAGPTPHHYMIYLTADQGATVSYRGSHNSSAAAFLAGTDTARTFGNLSAGTTYAWRMRSFHTTGVIYYGSALGLTWKSDWSAPETFTTAVAAREGMVEADFSVHPNPTRGDFKLSYTLAEKSDVQLKVFNVLGETVHEESMLQFSGQLERELSLNTGKGIYFLELTVDKQSLTKKIVVQ